MTAQSAERKWQWTVKSLMRHRRGRRKIREPEYMWGCCEQTPGHDRAVTNVNP